MGRATKLGHRACRRLWVIALCLRRRGYGRGLILRSLLGTERWSPSHISWKWLPGSTRRGRVMPSYTVLLSSRIGGTIRGGAGKGVGVFSGGDSVHVSPGE